MSRSFDTRSIARTQQFTQPITVDGKKITNPNKIRTMNAIRRKGYGQTQGALSMKRTHDALGQNERILVKQSSIQDSTLDYFFNEISKIAEYNNTQVISEILEAFKAEGGALGMKALHKRVKAPKAVVSAALAHLKKIGKIKQHPHGDLYTPMVKESSIKDSSLFPDHLDTRAGFIDPRSKDFAKNQATGAAMGIGALGAIPASAYISGKDVERRIASGAKPNFKTIGKAALTGNLVGLAGATPAALATYYLVKKKALEQQKKGINPATGKPFNLKRIKRLSDRAEKRAKNLSPIARARHNARMLEVSGIKKKASEGKGVYLPAAKISRLKSSPEGRKKLRSAERKKAKATSRGEQYSSHGLAAGTSMKKVAHGCRPDMLQAFKAEGGALDIKKLLEHTKGKQPEHQVRKELKKMIREGVVKQHPHGDLYTTKTFNIQKLREKVQKKKMEKRASIEYRGKTFPGYGKPIASDRKNKKKMVLVKRGDKVKVVHFGQKGYQDFTQHKDKKRRKNYLTRSAGIKNKSGQLTKNDPFSPNYWARKELW